MRSGWPWSVSRPSPAPALPAGWAESLTRELPIIAALPAVERARLATRVAEFVATIPFVGCGELVVSDRMRAIIATQASVLTLGLPGLAYGRLHGVMLYPDQFLVEESAEDDDTGVVTEGIRALSGQTIDTDRIVLSWQDVEDGLQRDDGYNVVVHEFAHHLDHATGGRFTQSDPALRAGYDDLCDAVDRGEETLIDPYGAEEPAEFFAVLAEAFIGMPRELRAQHPDLYAAMRRTLQLDPADWPT